MAAVRLDFTPSLPELKNILTWAREQIDKTSLNSKAKMHLELALEELLVNLIEHQELPSSIEASLTSSYSPGRDIQFELIDNATPFNPLEYGEEEPPSSIEELKVGGVGLKLVKNCVDTIVYRRENDTNILTIVKTDG